MIALGKSRHLIEYSLDQGEISTSIPLQVAQDIIESVYSDVVQTASYYSEKKEGYGREVAQETLERSRRIYDFLNKLHSDSINLIGIKEEIEALDFALKV